MKNKLITYLSNITLIIGAVLAGYVLIDFIIQQSRLPEGACPLTDNKTIIIVAIVFLLISFIFSVIEQRQKKKAKRDSENKRDEPAETDNANETDEK